MSTDLSSPSGQAQAPGSTAQVWCPTVQTHQQSVYTNLSKFTQREGPTAGVYFVLGFCAKE